MKQAKGRQLLAVVRQGERENTDCQLTLRARDQAQGLIVVLGRWGNVYAIINLGTCLFARD